MQERHFRIEQNPIDLRVIRVPCANLNHRQGRATDEGSIANAGDAIRNGYADQARAATEGIKPEAGDAIRNRDACQAGAALEGGESHTGDAATDCDAREAGAVTEGEAPNTGDRITLDGVGNHQFTSGVSITIGNGDFAASSGPCQVA